MQTAVYYIEANVVCAGIFVFLLIHDFYNIDRQEKQVKFDRALVAFVLYFLTDCLFILIVQGVTPQSLLLMGLVSFLIYLFMAAIAYFWLAYVMAVEHVAGRNDSKKRFILLCPFLISTILLLLTYMIAPHMLMTDNMKQTSVYYIFMLTVPIIYMIAILFYTIKRARQEDNPLEKSKHLFIGFLPLMVVSGGILQAVFLPDLPLFCFVSLFLMLVFYTQSLTMQISIDPLTNLNNRSQLTRYISQRSNLYHEDGRTVAIMMDIDRFKAINDTYGHAAGDRALVIVAGALKEVVSRQNYPAFLGRYGGDEFIAIINVKDPEEAERLIWEFQEEVGKKKAGAGLAFELALSAGYSELEGEPDTIQSCIERADRELYLDKERKNLNRKRNG